MPARKSTKRVKVQIKRRDGVIQAYYVRRENARAPAPRRQEQGRRGPTSATSREASPPAAAPGPTEEPRRARVVASTEVGYRRVRGARYYTGFKAMGTMGELERMSGDSPDLLEEAADDFAAPAAFYSNQSDILGRVKWDGIMPFDSLIDLLNTKLQFKGEESFGFDFRDAYSAWEYRYIVVESFGGRLASERQDTIVVERRAAQPKRRGWLTR